MHQHRLVGVLACGAALLTLLFVPVAAQAVVPRSTTTVPEPTPPGDPTTVPTPTIPTPADSPSPAPSSSPSASPASIPTVRPALTRAQLRRLRVRRRRAIVLRIARRQLGVAYVWGGASRGGFDCSGLTMYVYRRAGVSLAHGATYQAGRGRRVSLRHLRPADLVFYGSAGSYYHVAIYIGRGRIIEAPRPGYRVRIAPLRDASAARRYIGA